MSKGSDMMTKNALERPTNRGFLINVAAFVVVIAGMQAASSIIVPFLLAMFITIICAPPFFWLKRKGISTGFSMIIIILGVICLGSLIVAMIGTSVDKLTNAMPFYEQRLKSQIDALFLWLRGMGANIPEEPFIKPFELNQIMELTRRTLSGMASVLSNTLLITLTVIFMLLEASGFPAKLRASTRNAAASLSSFYQAIDNIKRYVAIKSLISLGTGIGVVIFLSVLGVDFPVLWGLLAFLLNFVPNIGSIIAAVPAVMLALVEMGPGTAALTALGYLVVNFIFANLIEPRVMGRGLGLSTLVVFLSLVFWGWVLGPVGMLLSVPLTMTAKIILDSHEETRGLAILLGSDPHVSQS